MVRRGQHRSAARSIGSRMRGDVRVSTAAHSRTSATHEQRGRRVCQPAVRRRRPGRGARTVAPPRAAETAVITSHIARLRSQALEHQFGGERDEHDRHRQVGGGEHREPGMHAVVDRRVGERDPRREPRSGGDREPVEQLAAAAGAAPGTAAPAAAVAISRPPMARSASRVRPDRGSRAMASSATSTLHEADRADAAAPSAIASSRGASCAAATPLRPRCRRQESGRHD